MAGGIIDEKMKELPEIEPSILCKKEGGAELEASLMEDERASEIEKSISCNQGGGGGGADRKMKDLHKISQVFHSTLEGGVGGWRHH